MFEVPYELPFIALTEKAFTQLVNEQYEVLQRGIAIHKRLERLVLEEQGLDELVRALAAATGGGGVRALGARRHDRLAGVPAPAAGRVREGGPRRGTPTQRGAGERRRLPADRAEFAPDHAEIAGRSLVLPVAIRGGGAPQAWLSPRWTPEGSGTSTA